jgi:hypothetical protein
MTWFCNARTEPSTKATRQRSAVMTWFCNARTEPSTKATRRGMWS